MMEEKNPIYRPRGMTEITSVVKNTKTYVILYGIFAVLVSLMTMGLVIVGNELTKEMWVLNDGLVVSGDTPVSTLQATEIHDFDSILVKDDPVKFLSDMRYVMLAMPDWTYKYMVTSWKATTIGVPEFQVNTTDNHILEFNGTHLSWDGYDIAEVVEESVQERRLLGWKEKLAKRVKKKLDSPLCNSEALVDNIRGLQFATAPACHVGVSAAKIYMHYTK